MPDWSTRVELGSIGVPTAELAIVNEGDLQENGSTGSGEGGFNDQLLLTDIDGSFNLFGASGFSVGRLKG